ncbi:carboxypeptidase-like regulatory domain-containing protein [Aliifodinibius sp. S!AR15-10]|uniref:carboxypeptidase-like regulatory domain-containing protein n=1 Tax=Aliifodinibius sp. S!AR15-10 TaxID=2950437 RepID=UPI002863DF81|nr:carboxypeptidase-like regulatory domain-containing protein [Aliifodinibius sp. S!AR15-10]MDR8393521.1 carboxypeptidase-like regulatory domain-containing protein [Aliifodinibius sp. S!AR15-10]
MFSRKISSYALLALFMGLMFTVTAYAQVEKDTLTAPITGTVIDTETQQPVSGVELKIKDTEYTAQTNEEGKFSFMGLVPGMYTITATPEDYQEVSEQVELTASGKELTIELKLSSSS